MNEIYLTQVVYVYHDLLVKVTVEQKFYCKCIKLDLSAQ